MEEKQLSFIQRHKLSKHMQFDADIDEILISCNVSQSDLYNLH